LQDVNSNQQTRGLQANVVVDRDAAARLGISPTTIDNTLYDAFGQRQVRLFISDTTSTTSSSKRSRAFCWSRRPLQKIYVKSSTGKQIPLSAVAKFETGNANLEVDHQGQYPAVTISFNLDPKVSLGLALKLCNKRFRNCEYLRQFKAAFRARTSFSSIAIQYAAALLAAALLTVYIVLGMLYESLIHPITILSTLPSAGSERCSHCRSLDSISHWFLSLALFC